MRGRVCQRRQPSLQQMARDQPAGVLCSAGGVGGPGAPGHAAVPGDASNRPGCPGPCRSRPPYLRAELPLGPSLTAPEVARRFVVDACWQWRLHAADDPKDPMARLWGRTWSTGPCWWPASSSPMRWSTPKVPCGCGWSYAGRLHLAVADRSPRLSGWPPSLATPTPKAAGGCWWSSNWPAPGGCTIPPRAARSSGACWSADRRLLTIGSRPRPAGALRGGGTPDPCHRDHPARPRVKLEPP